MIHLFISTLWKLNNQSSASLSGSWHRVKRTLLFEADLNGDKVLKEDIVDMGVVQVEELFQFWWLCIFWKMRKEKKVRIK